MQHPQSLRIQEIEDQIARLNAELAQLRREAPRDPVPNEVFLRPDGTPIRLVELFGSGPDLIAVHNMGASCPYCTLAADSFNGVHTHIAARAAFVLVSPDPPEVLGAFARERGWRFPVVSSNGNAFARSLGFEPEQGKCWPGASGLRREGDGVVTRVSSASFGPGDVYCPVWHLFDLLADGAGDWHPRFSY